ncbi:MAG: hypothetical protein R3324_08505 [Halobacteriales archaeon]|nr:hypothetical protein [Halobacteriales archaeon]
MGPPEPQLSPAGSHLPQDIEEVGNVLLLAPALERKADEACMRLLTPVPPEAETVLYVTFTNSADDRLSHWRTHATGPPAGAGVVCVGELARSAGAIADGAEAGMNTSVGVETVTDPADLTGLGIAINRFIDRWADNDRKVVVCFDSITTLLQYADLERAFRFLHVLTGRVRSAGALAHYHMDPSAHDEGDKNTLMAVFDAVVSVDDDGELVVVSR